MCIRWAELGLAALLLAATAAAAWAQGYPSRFELGAPATEQDIAAVATAIPADGKGLPPGKGEYAQGKQVYESACAACHGANLLGVAGLPDMPAGAALRLIGGRGTLTSQKPIVTVESYWPYATTLFDYIRRAMPLYESKSLTNDEVYGVVAYVLNLNGVVADDATMNAQTLPKVVMPNREGFTKFQRGQ
jgi:S-disulfanyl-L-cysteine oxidoreductase SoxD